MRLIIAQRWAGFSHDRHAFVICVNDEITGQRAGFPQQVERDFAAASGQIRPHQITEEQARDRLERMSRPRERRCEGELCRARLPLGGLYCVRCGLPGPRPPAASPAPASLVLAREPVAAR